ncbi:MAG: transporter substrate-binding protein [Gammaproteobacteria bacterium]|nr:transporter substrate-binding protein [Gammaproteobacteria bacterium]
MIERETDGKLSLHAYHSGQLGRENDTVDLARFGITRINFASLNNPVPATQVMSLPYVFDSTEHMRRAVDGLEWFA